MNGIAAIKGYVDRLITGDGRCRGMKVLILDAATTQVVSCAVSQTDILAREVYLVSRLDHLVAERHKHSEDVSWGGDDEDVDIEMSNLHTTATASSSPSMSHLKAVCFVRPTEENVTQLIQEIQHRPRFSEYHIFFSGVVTTGLVRRLAEADALEVVKQVQEFYADFLAINEDLVTLNSRDAIAMTVTAGTSWARDHAPLYQRHKDGLASLLLALKRKPAAIRYQQVRTLCRRQTSFLKLLLYHHHDHQNH
jgi:vacuolar protein sorting-associated protein 45